jgi:hypothetical protein
MRNFLFVHYFSRTGREKNWKYIDFSYTRECIISLSFSSMLDKIHNFNFSVEKAVWWAWIIFTSLFFLGSVFFPFIYNQTQGVALQAKFQEGQFNGYNTAFSLLGQALESQVKEGCKQPLPVTVASGQTMGIVNYACLAQAQQQAPAPAAPQAPAK